MLEANHKAECLCKAFGTTCDKMREMQEQVREALKRADTLSEALELAYQLGRTENEKLIYVHICSSIIQHCKENGENAIEDDIV